MLLQIERDPGGEPVHEVIRGQRRVEVVVEVVQCGEDRGEYLVQAGREPLAERVVGEDGGEQRADRVPGRQPVDRAPHGVLTRTWWS